MEAERAEVTDITLEQVTPETPEIIIYMIS
jgi:hypothetical protein